MKNQLKTNQNKLIICILGLSLINLLVLNTNGSISSYITPRDKIKFKEVLVKSFIIKENDDYSSSYFGIKGFQILNDRVAEVLIKDNCAHLKNQFKASESSSETIFQALSAWNLLNCQGSLHSSDTITKIKSILEDSKSSLADIRFALEIFKVLGQNAPQAAKISQLVQSKLKENDSFVNFGHALHSCAILGSSGKFILDQIDSILVQADEVDGKLLQFEGGLSVTSSIISGILRLDSSKLNREQAEKFSSYFLSRKTVQTPKGVSALLETLNYLVSSANSPVSIGLFGNARISSENSELKVRISDLFGGVLKKIPSPVLAQSATRISDDVVVLSKQPLLPSSVQSEFILSLKLDPGQYKIVLTAGEHSAILIVGISGPIKLDWLEIGLSDSDGSSAPKLNRLVYRDKLDKILQADSSQILLGKFSVNKKIHQSFLRLFSGKKEIIFVAEPDNNGNIYKLEINLGVELGQSGKFQMELILGDFVVSNPIRWIIGEINVNLGAIEEKVVAKRGVKPDIQHLFRQAEKRPSEAVSMFFTVLTAAPLLVLAVLWGKIGVNFGNFSFGAVPFHLGFGAILGLFALFWFKLDMFSTCAWLIPIGGFTFLAGQKALSQIARKKKV